MEDVYTIKVKSKPDTRNVYPSERRYSASTASGLAWVHIALAATSFLLACLALVNQSSDNHMQQIKLNEMDQKIINMDEFLMDLNEEINNNVTNTNTTNNSSAVDVNSSNWYVLVIAACMLSTFALSAGIASILASIKWYIDHNITWLLIMSVLSTVFSLISFIMVLIWFTNTEGDDEIAQFYKEANFKDYFVVKETDIIDRNKSHLILKRNEDSDDDDHSNLFTKRVLSINILIAAFLEFLWSLLSVKISYKGMINNYKDDEERQGNCIEVVTTYKGNDGNIPRNGRILPPKPDLIVNTNKKIKRVILGQDENGFYLKNTDGDDKLIKQETNSEYKERMINFLNGCANGDAEGSSSIQCESVNTEKTAQEPPKTPIRDTMTPVSWGDTPEHTIYNQNTINFDKIFKLNCKIEEKNNENNETNDK